MLMSKRFRKTKRFTATMLCLGLMGLFLQANAQNYQMVNSSVTTTFIGDNNQIIESIRIDSSYVHAGDSVFYPFYNMQWIENCYTPFSHSWIGKSIIVQADGYNCFINRDNDTVKVNTLAQLNDNWVTYQTPDIIVMAEVIEHDVVSFLGQMDSAKTILFTVYDPNMDSVIPHSVNEMTVIISKNYGMIKTLNFGLFPNGTPKYQELQTYNLLGMSSPEIGIVNLTWREIYDFEVGDEIHIVEIHGIMAQSDVWETKYIYLDKIEQLNTIEYKIDREIRKRKMYGEVTGYIHDTITEPYHYDFSIDKLSGETVEEGEYLNEIRMEVGDILKKAISHDRKRGSLQDSCWHDYYIGCSNHNYLKGLGGPYYDCLMLVSPSMYRSDSRKLQYYKKGDVTWGSPLSIEDIKISNGFVKIYPNPTCGLLQVASYELQVTEIQIYDIVGRCLQSIKPLLSQEQTIDISHWGNGMYFLKVITTNREIIHKVVKY